MHINFMAVLVAALVPMIMGFIWYNPKVFGTLWSKEAGVTEEMQKTANMPLIFGLAFLFSLILSMGINTIATHDTFVYGTTFYFDK